MKEYFVGKSRLYRHGKAGPTAIPREKPGKKEAPKQKARVAKKMLRRNAKQRNAKQRNAAAENALEKCLQRKLTGEISKFFAIQDKNSGNTTQKTVDFF